MNGPSRCAELLEVLMRNHKLDKGLLAQNQTVSFRQMISQPIVRLKSNYSGDLQAVTNGEGIAHLPLFSEELNEIIFEKWLMSPIEQLAFVYLLERLRPAASIEIGTRFGGSLQVVSKFSQKVYSLDIDPEVLVRLKGKHSNVEYIIGDSAKTIPKLIEHINKSEEVVSFILIDGDHTAQGVRNDIEAVLKIEPKAPLFIVLHDSYNPPCREGIATANWSMNPHVHMVELDFVPGAINPSESVRGELWGGLGLAVLLPEKRTGKLEVTSKDSMTVENLNIAHQKIAFQKRVRASLDYRLRKMKSVFGLR